MRIYAIEDISKEHMKRIREHLAASQMHSPIDDIYFWPVPAEQLDQEQREHDEKCGPYIMAIETGDTWVRLELLVRGRGKIRCSCIRYAPPALRNLAIDSLDAMIRELDIPV